MKITIEDYNVWVRENGKFKQIYPVESSQSCIMYEGVGEEIKHSFTYVENSVYTIKTFDNADVRFRPTPYTAIFTNEKEQLDE